MTTEKNKKAKGSNRRKAPRLKPGEVIGLKSVELNQGADIEIVNISRGGMLLETEARLRPDFKIVLKVLTNKGPLRIDGVVLRSAICSLMGGPRYRSAIEFKQPLELLDEAVALKPEITHSDEDSLQLNIPEENGTKAPAILTVMASDENGVCLKEKFSLDNM